MSHKSSLVWSLSISLTSSPLTAPLPHFFAAELPSKGAPLAVLDKSLHQNTDLHLFFCPPGMALPQIFFFQTFICLTSYNLSFHLHVTSSESSLWHSLSLYLDVFFFLTLITTYTILSIYFFVIFLSHQNVSSITGTLKNQTMPNCPAIQACLPFSFLLFLQSH